MTGFLSTRLFLLLTQLAQGTPATPTAPVIVPDSVQKARWTDFITKISNLDEAQISSFFKSIISGAIGWAFKIVVAVVVYLVCRRVIRWLLHIADRAMTRHKVELSLRSFLRNLIRAILMFIVILVVVGILGFDLTSLVVLFSVATLAIGMALSNTAQNFAGGVMILLTKPYRVGDMITAQGQTGVVEEIKLFSTVILTADHQTVYLPNNTISTSIINNYSTATQRRAEWSLPISSGTDIDLIRKEIFAIFAADSRILSDPAPAVWITALDGSTLTISARAWTGNADYWDVFFQTYDKFYKTLPQKGIPFSYQQVELIGLQNAQIPPTK